MLIRLLMVLCLATPGFAAQRPFELDDLFKMDRVASVAISPDGEQIAAVTERWTEERYWATHSHLWLISTRAGKLSQAVEEGDASQSLPVWSPNGSLLAYLTQKDQKTSLRVLRLKGAPRSETLPGCNDKESISTFAWSPDNTQLAVMCDHPVESDSTQPTIIIASQSPLYHGKAAPFTERRVVLVDLTSRKTRELAKNQTFLGGEGALLWSSPQTLTIVATPEEDYPGSNWIEGRVLHRVDLATGALTTAPIPQSGSGMPVLSPNRQELMLPNGKAITTMDRRNWQDTWKLRPFTVQRVTMDGKVLSTTAPVEIYSQSKQAWVGGTYYAQFLDHASVRVKALSLQTQRWSDVTPADKEVKDFSISADGRKMAVVMGDANTPFEVYVLDLRHNSATPKPLTHFGAAVKDLYAVSPVEHLTWRSKDDRFDVNGWLVKPANAVLGKRYPLIVDVHGGPGVLFHNSFDIFHFEGAHEVAPELYAARGYMVLMVNPRGDPGYGRAYQEALREGWPNATRYDIFAGIDEVIRRGYVDPDRLGIAGASYGGWVTAFAVTQTNRFKAASANDPVINTSIASAVTYRGDRGSNYWMLSGFSGGLPGDVPQQDIQPDQVKTPILLRFGLKGDAPYTSQFPMSGLPYFTYLDSHCVVPVEMIVHTQEGHGIFNWVTLRDYINRDLTWFDYWIKGEGTAPVKPRDCG